MNVFVAGFHHETNTFAPSVADWAAFECGAGYPSYSRGAPMLQKMRGTSTSLGGFAQGHPRHTLRQPKPSRAPCLEQHQRRLPLPAEIKQFHKCSIHFPVIIGTNFVQKTNIASDE